MIGILLAGLILILWVSSLARLLFINVTQLAPLIILFAVLGRTFIQTGLFIVAHDSIHGSTVPHRYSSEQQSQQADNAHNTRRLNNLIGQTAVTLYAFLSYRQLTQNHWRHHQYSGRAGDPDFHQGNCLTWYCKFMQEYLDLRQGVVQIFGMAAIFLALYVGLHVAIVNLVLFWIVPIVLSSMQLFYFGTYLPHHLSSSENAYHVTSSNYPILWSFLTCYHFGYHWEHHQYPSLPWYRLPSVRKI